jgi:phage baseplate assembly protein W
MATTPIFQGVPWTPDPAIGVDICLTSTAVPGDLALTPSGDLQLIGNTVPLQNIWQATILRLITTLRTYIFAETTDYGTKARQFIDQPMTATVQQQLQTEITNTILQDPRIKQVNTLTVVASPSNPQGYVVTLNFMARSSNQSIGGNITIAAENPSSEQQWAIWNEFQWGDGSLYWR